jgi:hypothetical protein
MMARPDNYQRDRAHYSLLSKAHISAAIHDASVERAKSGGMEWLKERLVDGITRPFKPQQMIALRLYWRLLSKEQKQQPAPDPIAGLSDSQLSERIRELGGSVDEPASLKMLGPSLAKQTPTVEEENRASSKQAGGMGPPFDSVPGPNKKESHASGEKEKRATPPLNGGREELCAVHGRFTSYPKYVRGCAEPAWTVCEECVRDAARNEDFLYRCRLPFPQI